MPITWTERLSVGVPWIDEEHKELFVRINRLLEATGALRGREEVRPVLGFLAGYVESHFGHEQRHMELLGYPEAAAHLREHAFFVAELQWLAAEVEANGPSTMVTVKLNRLLCGWLRDHTSSSDRRLGAFLKAAGQKRSA